LIGCEPIVLATPQQGAPGTASYVTGGLFVLALLGIWALAAWYAREDRRFHARMRPANFTLPNGQSSDNLNLPARDEPMTIWAPTPANRPEE
jgi:hypothetical protein